MPGINGRLMMARLGSLKRMQAVDRQNMLALLLDFPRQLEEAKRISLKINVTAYRRKKIKNIVFTGLGGSAIGANVLKDAFRDRLKIPFAVNRDYTVPNFVNQETLLVACSYSGNTEETLSAYADAKKKKALIVTISSGGKLEALSQKDGYPHVHIPAGLPPRAAIAYSVIPGLAVLKNLGLIHFSWNDFAETVRLLKSLRQEYRPQKNTANPAKKIAENLYGHYAIFYSASDDFEALALRWRGQIAENAKALTSHHLIPEMNHNEIVGWENPPQIVKDFAAVFLRDKGEHSRVQYRMQITQQLLVKKGIRVLEVHSRGNSLLARIFSLIYLGDFVSFYLAVLYETDPTPVQVIDYLKHQLAKI